MYGPIASGEIKGDFVPGLEFAGIVEKIGSIPKSKEKVDTLNGIDQRFRGSQLVILNDRCWNLAKEASKHFKVGDRVMGATRFGAYTNRLNIVAHQCRKIPDGWKFEHAGKDICNFESECYLYHIVIIILESLSLLWGNY